MICDVGGNQQDEWREKGKEDRLQLIVEKRRRMKQRRLLWNWLLIFVSRFRSLRGHPLPFIYVLAPHFLLSPIPQKT